MIPRLQEFCVILAAPAAFAWHTRNACLAAASEANTSAQPWSRTVALCFVQLIQSRAAHATLLMSTCLAIFTCILPFQLGHQYEYCMYTVYSCLMLFTWTALDCLPTGSSSAYLAALFVTRPVRRYRPGSADEQHK